MVFIGRISSSNPTRYIIQLNFFSEKYSLNDLGENQIGAKIWRLGVCPYPHPRGSKPFPLCPY